VIRRGDPVKPWARYQKVRLLEKQRKYQQAENGWHYLSQLYSGKNIGQTMLENLILLYHKQDKLTKAADACEQYVKKYRNHWKARKVYARLGRIRFQQTKYQQAQLAFHQAAQYKTDYITRAYLLFMEAEAYRNLGQKQAEREIKQKLAWNYFYTYYGLKSAKDLNIQLPELNNAKYQKPEPVWQQRIPRIKQFIAISDYEDAAILTEVYRKSNPARNLAISRFIIDLYEKAGDYAAAQRRAENIFNYYRNRRKLRDLPKIFWQKSFPLYYWRDIVNHTRDKDLDPYLVLALIREESRFREGVNSWAGAVGLMQLMPATARAEAKKHSLPLDGNLRSADYNLKIGILHLDYLVDAYKNEYIYALAAYNGGINATNRWIQKFGHQRDDNFIVNIGFQETRFYVRKVLRSYWIYKWLYS
jgi:soluble lytic murein transglycosylase